ncbi:MAG: hemerythrin domain-containing protein [Rhodocyclaceae bacterium]
MAHLTGQLAAHHKHCDEGFADAEDAVRAGDWETSGRALEQFRNDLETHFGAEEEVLFPAFESMLGTASGPTQVMRMEHSQMRALVDQTVAAQAARDADAFLGAAETLLIMLQQHNLKEENILYPMCERALGADPTVAERIGQALATSAA